MIGGGQKLQSGNHTLAGDFGSFRNSLMGTGQASNQHMMMQNSNIDALAHNIAVRQ
jgi:hypothetical protein